MLDPSIIENLRSIGLPPEATATAAIMRSWDHHEIAALRREVDAYVAQKQLAVDRWLESVRNFVRATHSVPRGIRATPEQMQDFDDFIAAIESKTEGLIVEHRKFKNGVKRRIKEDRMSADRLITYKIFVDRASQLSEQLLKSFLDLTWQARSLRAQVRPDQGTGPTFNHPEDLEHYLSHI